jgi:hypothetical protein
METLMHFLNNSDLNTRPVLKFIIIAILAVNAVILALLLFGPEQLLFKASPGSTDNASSVSTGIVLEKDEDEDTKYKEKDTIKGEDSDQDNTNTAEVAWEEDEDGPVLRLTKDHITLKVGEYFNFYEYIDTMRDRDGSDLSHYIHLQGEVNTYTPGEYRITYQITSPIDGKTASKDLLVTVEY